MDKIYNKFRDLDKKMISSALYVSKNNIKKAYSILSTSNQKTKNKLYKTYNYLGYFNNLDACSGIYHFLNFFECINLLKTSVIFSDKLLQFREKTLKPYKNIVDILNNSSMVLEWKIEKNNLDTNLHVCRVNYIDFINSQSILPFEFKQFVKCIFDLKISHNFIFLGYKDLHFEILNYHDRKSKCIQLFGIYCGMGYTYLLSYSFDNNDKQKKYFLSMLGGENGYVSMDNYSRYVQKNINEIKFYTFNKALMKLCTYVEPDNVL